MLATIPLPSAVLRRNFIPASGQAYGSNIPVYWFEPHVAEQTFLQMLSGAGVSHLHKPATGFGHDVQPDHRRKSPWCDGTIYRAKEFIDATYEGDLDGAIRSELHVGPRKHAAPMANRWPACFVNSVQYPCDPYVIPGNPASGLLPLIQSDTPAAAGSGDSKIAVLQFSPLPDPEPNQPDSHHRSDKLFRGDL